MHYKYIIVTYNMYVCICSSASWCLRLTAPAPACLKLVSQVAALHAFCAKTLPKISASAFMICFILHICYYWVIFVLVNSSAWPLRLWMISPPRLMRTSVGSPVRGVGNTMRPREPSFEQLFLKKNQEPKGEGNWHGGCVAYSWDRVASRSLCLDPPS